MTDYSGRHRPPTRAERRTLRRRSYLPKSLTPAFALPTAAAVALALTAAGATAAQSSSSFGGEATAEAAQGAISAPGSTAGSDDESATDLLDDPQLAETARTQAADASRDSSGLAERRQQASATLAEDQGREQERTRAARSDAREELSADKTKSTDEDSGSDEASETDEWVKPLDNAVFTSPFGHRWGKLHAGQDYAAPEGTPLKSMGTGTVIGAGPMGGYGTYIDIEYTDGSVSRYGHLSSVSATVGQDVAPGDVVARSGNSGTSTGPHLHVEIHPDGGEPIDPAGWLAERGID